LGHVPVRRRRAVIETSFPPAATQAHCSNAFAELSRCPHALLPD
jgi:hypothetical protein